MAKTLYSSINNVSHRSKAMYWGVDNKSRKVKKGYIGIGGVARLFWSSAPDFPSGFNLVNTYTSSQTFTAPDDGFYLIDLYGASGNGGSGDGDASSYTSDGDLYSTRYYYAGGGGGGSGGFSRSLVQLNQGDTIVLTVGAAGTTATCVINSTVESYDTMLITSGEDGTDGVVEIWDLEDEYDNTSGSATQGKGGAGGIASGGNKKNVNGLDGLNGLLDTLRQDYAAGGDGAEASVVLGTIGGNGGGSHYVEDEGFGCGTGTAGASSFAKIYQGYVSSSRSGAMPSAPSSYELIKTYTSDATYTIPETGYFQIELHGRSGAGGKGDGYTTSGDYGTTVSAWAKGGGGGGGGAYSRSICKLNKGDIITIDIGTTCVVNITSSVESNIYEMIATTAKDGFDSDLNWEELARGGVSAGGGAGGIASGGNIDNVNGSQGEDGYSSSKDESATSNAYAFGDGGKGGAPGHIDGNVGGVGETMYAGSEPGTTASTYEPAGSATAGFVKISRGNTN